MARTGAGRLGGELPEDTDWLTFETVKFRINPALNAEQREALRMDYGLAGETPASTPLTGTRTASQTATTRAMGFAR